jgi:hypothetical protein
MAYTTGSTSFNLDLNDLVEEAFERCGQELRSGYDFRTARRSLNLLTIEWANRGINLWTIEQGVIDLVQGQNTYSLPVDTIDLLEHQIRTNANSQPNQTDITISRISVSTYATIPNKLAQGRPIQVWFQRLTGQSNNSTYLLASNINSTTTTIPLNNTDNLAAAGFIQIGSEVIYYQYIENNTLYNCARAQQNTAAASHAINDPIYVVNLPAVTVWPTPDQGQVGSPYYQFVYWRLRRIQDAGNGVNVQDIPFRFINCMVAGLAYYLSIKLPNVDPTRVAALKAEYEQQFDLAAAEDRETAPVRWVPRRAFIGGG